MKLKLNVLSVLTVLCLISTSAFANKIRYQKVEIKTHPQNTILIDGEEPKKEKGEYLIPKDQKTHLITVEREGYKSEVMAVVPYKSNGFTYPDSYTLGMDLIPIPEKTEGMKNIRVNEIAVDIKLNNNQIRVFKDYDYFLRKEDKVEAEPFENEDKDIKFENTVFASQVNEFLKQHGFIDTSDKVFKNGYLNNLIADAKISEYTYHRAPASAYFDYGGMIYIDLQVEWTIKDIYGEVLHTYTTKASSDQHAYQERGNSRETTNESIADALEKSLLELMKTSEAKKAMKDNSILTEEQSFTALKLPGASAYAADLNDAVKASVTVKLEEQHGSGFLISPAGHIITNYHVISEDGELAESIKIVDNSKNEYEVEVVRVSKIHDLALLKLTNPPADIKPLKISKSTEIMIASDIFAVGTPKAEDLSQTISKGIISGIRETDQGSKLIQIDASINSGNSGGAIVNKSASVIGVVSSKLFGFGVEGVAFGIPAYDLFERLKINY